MKKLVGVLLILSFILAGWGAAASINYAEENLATTVYLPVLMKPDACATTSSNSYASGFVSQFDMDNPVRPAYNHADKNIELRGYTLNTDSSLQRELVDYGSDDPTQPPQFATLFEPNRVPTMSGFYQVHQWNWASSPQPGERAEPISQPKVTALGFDLEPGTTLHAPTSGYDIGGGMEVVVLFADEDTVTLHYTREDTGALGYTLHIDQICTDPNLLALYNSLDDPNGSRYEVGSGGYNLPTLPAGQVFGTVGSSDMVLAVADTGTYQDARSCFEWWQIRPGYTGSCPPQQ